MAIPHPYNRACPRCNAPPGMYCIRPNGTAREAHAVRGGQGSDTTPCDHCRGTGAIAIGHPDGSLIGVSGPPAQVLVRCTMCHGTGVRPAQKVRRNANPELLERYPVPCPDCGSGVGEPCTVTTRTGKRPQFALCLDRQSAVWAHQREAEAQADAKKRAAEIMDDMTSGWAYENYTTASRAALQAWVNRHPQASRAELEAKHAEIQKIMEEAVTKATRKFCEREGLDFNAVARDIEVQ